MSTTGHDIFLTSTPTDFRRDVPGGPISRTENTEREREAGEGGDTLSSQQVSSGTSAEFVDLQTVKQVL